MEILSLRQRLDRIDWSADWEKADQENVQIPIVGRGRKVGLINYLQGGFYAGKVRADF